jgi:ribosome-binding protein aMBF1 (putative translation factor)
MRCEGSKVVQAREALGLSREAVAHTAGVSRSVIERMEGGAQVFDDSVRVVAEVLGLSFVELTQFDDIPND